MTAIKEESVDNGGFLKGFALSGDYVKELKDKSFEIVQLPFYKVMSDLDDKDGEPKEKLILNVKLSDGATVEYYPNKTSQKTIMAKCGFKLSAWVGHKGEFEVVEQMVGQNKKQVIYVK